MEPDRLVAYVDLLGFSKAIENYGDRFDERMLVLLKSLARQNRDFLKEIKNKGNERNITIYPSISAFSDHIIYSYPLSAFESTPAFFALEALAYDVYRILEKAMEFGCLVRGGITIGPLYHKGGVIFGKAMLKAYKIESQWAHYPRIIIDDSVRKIISHDNQGNPLIYRSDDGFWCLDYMAAAFDRYKSHRPNGEDFIINNREWISEFRMKVNNEIVRLNDGNNMDALKYWNWALSDFNRMIKRYHCSITGEPS